MIQGNDEIYGVFLCLDFPGLIGQVPLYLYFPEFMIHVETSNNFLNNCNSWYDQHEYCNIDDKVV